MQRLVGTASVLEVDSRATQSKRVAAKGKCQLRQCLQRKFNSISYDFGSKCKMVVLEKVQKVVQWCDGGGGGAMGMVVMVMVVVVVGGAIHWQTVPGISQQQMR